MKKLLLALPLVAGASWAGTTYYSGAQTRPAFERLLEQMNSGQILLFESKDYDAGFMNSTAMTEVRLNDADSPEVLFTLRHKINHSPVSMVPESARFGAANIVTTLAMEKIEDDKDRAFLESFDTGEPFVMTTDVAIDGKTTSEIKINALVQTDDEKTISSSAAIINFITSVNGDVTGDGVLPSVIFSDDSNERAEMSNLTLNFDMDKMDGDTEVSKLIYDLVFDVNVEEAKVVDSTADEPMVLIKDIHYVADQKMIGDNPYVKHKMGVKSIIADEIPLQSANLETAITGFSLTEVIANADYFAGIQTADNPDELLFTGKGLTLIRSMFPPDTKLSISGDAESTDGGIDANIDLWFTGNGSADGYAGMVTIADLAKAFAGTVNITADKEAIMASPLGEMISHPFALLYLKITDDEVILNANLDKLQLDVNGQAIPLELMAGEMLQAPLSTVFGF